MGQARFHPEDTATATDLAQKLSDLKTPPVSADTAANIRKRYSGILLETDDLVQEALIEVLRAVKTYDPETGNLFLTYAQTTAENAMLDYVRKCASAIPASGSILSLDASPPGFDPEAKLNFSA